MIIAPFPGNDKTESWKDSKVHKISHPQLVHLFKNKYAMVLVLCISALISLLLISHHYQIDFSAYYSAAKVLALGGNPYLDSFTDSGGVTFAHSQFLQPPLVSALFWPLSLFPYFIAKTFWFLIQIPLIFGILYFSSANPTSRPKIIFQVSIPVAGSFFIFWPLYTLLERGQTDLLVLFWICLGYYLWKRGYPAAAGFVIIIAALFKLPAAFLLIVPVASRGLKPVIGASLAFALVLGASLLINGIELNRLYFTEYLPEIIQTGRITSENSTLENSESPSAQVVWEGQSYKTAAGFQASNGSIVRIISNNTGEISRGAFSLAAFSLISIFILVFLRLDRSERAGELAWVFALLSTLLFHPLTWVMSYVWLLPVVCIGSDIWRSYQPSIVSRVLAATGLVGMILICMNEPIFLQIFRWLDRLVAPIGDQMISVWANKLLVNRIWLGGSLLWICTLVIILGEMRTAPFVRQIRRILSLH
jgi:hypothetical protein